MYGAMYVVEDLDDYLADPEAYLSRQPVPAARPGIQHPRFPLQVPCGDRVRAFGHVGTVREGLELFRLVGAGQGLGFSLRLRLSSTDIQMNREGPRGKAWQRHQQRSRDQPGSLLTRVHSCPLQ